MTARPKPPTATQPATKRARILRQAPGDWATLPPALPTWDATLIALQQDGAIELDRLPSPHGRVWHWRLKPDLNTPTDPHPGPVPGASVQSLPRP